MSRNCQGKYFSGQMSRNEKLLTNYLNVRNSAPVFCAKSLAVYTLCCGMYRVYIYMCVCVCIKRFFTVQHVNLNGLDVKLWFEDMIDIDFAIFHKQLLCFSTFIH